MLVDISEGSLGSREGFGSILEPHKWSTHRVCRLVVVDHDADRLLTDSLPFVRRLPTVQCLELQAELA